MRITVVGTGYVGLTTAVALAYLGHEVNGVDRDRNKISRIRAGQSPIYEPGLEELMMASARSLTFTDNMEEALRDVEVVFLAVGTPPKPDGHVDLTYVENASLEIADVLRAGHSYTFVIKSTVPIGTDMRVATMVQRRLAERGVDASVSFALNPEFLRQGMAVHDTLYPDRIVVGTDSPHAAEILRQVYRPLLDQSFVAPSFLPRPEGLPKPRLVETNSAGAAMIKYASNAFLATKISFANEIAGLCERVGADIMDVTLGMGLDSRIGRRFLGAGVGWGGSCFPKDTLGLLAVGQEHDYAMPIIKAACEVNDRQRHVVVEKLQSVLGSLRGRVIGVLGVAFKPNTDDVREAPAVAIIRALQERGAFVRVHDPVVPPETIQKTIPYAEFVREISEVPRGCDALLLVTEWNEYRSLDLAELSSVMRRPVLVDGRNIYSPERAKAVGFTYLGMGR